ncbi:hypothetical protein [Paenibacillus larvae]|nr:hypothetical protein [Paenibacillus larvae]MCY7476706.1 hypothetical protein [Paenibacillus larvae]MDE5169045.1 hypothetical protein [Paenibacillus larvae subsp. larvae]
MSIEITDVVIVAVIVGLVEMAKGIGLRVRLAPVLSVLRLELFTSQVI